MDNTCGWTAYLEYSGRAPVSCTWVFAFLFSLSSDGDEKYEKTIIKSGDKMFYKFMKRIAACQEQILR